MIQIFSYLGRIFMPKGYQPLIRYQRSQIYALKLNNLTQNQIAKYLGVQKKTA